MSKPVNYNELKATMGSMTDKREAAKQTAKDVAEQVVEEAVNKDSQQSVIGNLSNRISDAVDSIADGVKGRNSIAPNFPTSNSDRELHFKEEIFGKSTIRTRSLSETEASRDADIYKEMTREIVSDNYIESLAKQNNMSVDEVKSVVKSSTSELGGPVDGEIGSFFGKVKSAESLKAQYEDYMNGYDEFVSSASNIGFGTQVMHKGLDRLKYGAAQHSAQSEINTYIEAREAIAGMKYVVSEGTYNELLASITDHNPTIANVISQNYPESSEHELLNQNEAVVGSIDKESVLSGVVLAGSNAIDGLADDKSDKLPLGLGDAFDAIQDKFEEFSESTGLNKIGKGINQFGEQIGNSFNKAFDKATSSSAQNRGYEFEDLQQENVQSENVVEEQLQ